MKKIYSLLACFIIIIVFAFHRVEYSEFGKWTPVKVTTWDALGYYMYLPSLFIYHDFKELKWFPVIDSSYSVSGGWFYQANHYKGGPYVFKYLAGVAILETPFFFAGHTAAIFMGYQADGFSPPYQWAIAVGTLVYFLLSLFLLRKILRRYFSDSSVAITLLLLYLASNAILYVTIESAQSHGYILPLYVFILYTTIKWHEKPTILMAILTGFIIGLASISRPTEAVMLFIPLLWNTHNKESAKIKWRLFRQNKSHIIAAMIGCFIGVLPQLVYWKYITGSFIYDVGSKWDFLTPHLRVLVGWEKGWFIYTPVTVLFILGLFFIKKYPFRNSVITFCLLNIYIIISWHVWRYGGSYSTRALVQSYPVFALPLAALVELVNRKKWCYLLYAVGLYLIFLNLFQIRQFNNTILHYDDMNRRYYGSIYLNSHPDPLDMSLLDNVEILRNENGYSSSILFDDSIAHMIVFQGESSGLIQDSIVIGNSPGTLKKIKWLRIESVIQVNKGFSSAFIHSELRKEYSFKNNRIRLFSPISQAGRMNPYEFYVKVPEEFQKAWLRIYITSGSDFDGIVKKLRITALYQ
jgi:hypothetical protein